MRLIDRLRLWLGLRIYIGDILMEGWTRPMPWYFFMCKKHGLCLDYEHGWRNETECPHCQRIRLAKKR